MSAVARAHAPAAGRTSAAARSGALAPARPTRTGPPRRAARRPLRVVPARAVGAPRTPFVLLVLTLLGAGLVVLLLLNAAAVSNSDQQRRLREQTASLKIHEQQLRHAVSSMEAPGALAERARRLGMVPSGDPAFLVLLPGGRSRIAGDPQPAPFPTATPSASATASGAARQGGRPTATPSPAAARVSGTRGDR
ncbi:MAG TPA: hypothetical protein VFX70_21235 [Mycobacteriales bacterium]|nr:hypothetical protein [Mycobacteriales bacterium]